MRRSLFCCLFALLFHSVAVHAQGVRDNELPESKLFQTLPGITGSFPKGVDGRPDWVQTLNKGLIAPRATKSGAPRPPEQGVAMPTEGIVFSNTQFMPHVVFPHQPHAEWLTCLNCHESLFEMKASGRGKGMTAIFQGEHCGFCHGRVAFSPEGSCYRCHSKPNPAAAQNNSPFVAPAKVEQAVIPDAEEDKSRRRGRRVPMASRLVPSTVPPPAAEVPSGVAPQLQ